MSSRRQLARDLFALFRRSARPREAGAKRRPEARLVILEARIAPALVINGTSSFSVDADGDGKGDRGDKIHYTVTVQNTGADLVGLSFADIINDPNLSLVPGSINVSPVAVNDSFNAVGNTQLRVGGT